MYCEKCKGGSIISAVSNEKMQDENEYKAHVWITREYNEKGKRIAKLMHTMYITQMNGMVGIDSKEYEIKFCPFCGRKFEED